MVFKLIVYAIAALALIGLILVIANAFFQGTDLVNEINEQLRKAEIDLGKLKTKNFNVKETTLQAKAFETNNRNIVFQCNDLKYCCDKSPLNELNTACNKNIVWNEKKVLIKKNAIMDVSSRCYFDKIFWCTIFIGQKPSQITTELKLAENLKEIETGKEYYFELKTTNIGEQFSVELLREITINLVLKETKTKINELQLPPIRLAPNDEIIEKIPFTVNLPGDIEIYVKTFETLDKTNFEEKTIKVKAIGKPITEEKCQADETRKEKEFDLELKKCVEKLFCKNCDFASECLEEWKKKGYNDAMQKTNEYAIRETTNC